MKSIKTLIFLPIITILFISSCQNKSQISGTLSEYAGDSLIIKKLNINHLENIDTLKIDNKGHFSYKTVVEKGEAEFIYLYVGEKKLNSLILLSGDKIKINNDKIEGSKESERLAEVDKDYNNFITNFNKISTSVNDKNIKEDQKNLSELYIKYYRSKIKEIISEPAYFANISLLFQKLPSGSYIFSQDTDVLYFKKVCDTLNTLYPNSTFVKSLKKETERREKFFELKNKLENTSQLAYPEIELPDNQGKIQKLSEVKSKLTLIYFWTSTEIKQKMFNIEVLKPLYSEFNDKGLEIYSICIDPNKANWANTIKEQKLNWINVNDGLGLGTEAVKSYNINRLPTLYVLENEELTSPKVGSLKEFRRYIEKKLK